MKRYHFLLAPVLISFFCVTALADNLPPAPEGYYWQRNAETKTAFLVPQKWHFHSERKGSTFGYFITKEKIEKDAEYETGIMVNVIPGITENLKVVPSKYMLTLLDEMKEESLKVERQWEQIHGPFKGIGLETIMGDKGNVWRQHALFISNDTTGTLYIIIFDTSLMLWQENWPIAEKILKQLHLDKTF